MTDVLRITDKFESIGIVSGVNFELDTKGLMCEMRPRGGNIYVFLEGQSGRITLKEDEKLTFCGKIGFKHSIGDVTVDCFYYHTL